MKKVGIQGLEGSFSEQAAKFYCNKFDIQDFELAVADASIARNERFKLMESSPNVILLL